MGRCLGVIGIKGADMLQDHGCSSDHRHLLSLDHEHFRSRFIIRGLECQPDICLETQKFTHQNTLGRKDILVVGQKIIAIDNHIDR